mgnify:CR=1 FL=1
MKGEKRVWRREDGCGGEKRAGKVRAARAGNILGTLTLSVRRVFC